MSSGWVAPEVADEFPGLELLWACAPGPAGAGPDVLSGRLGALSDRLRGRAALQARERPVEQAHRAFFRHVGLDPDVTRTPADAVLVERLRAGRFAARSLLDAALLVSVVETGVGVWALDAGRVRSELGIGNAGGRLAVCDGQGPVAALFADPRPDRAASRSSSRVLLYAIRVPGVPVVHVEEALWLAAGALEDGRDGDPRPSGSSVD